MIMIFISGPKIYKIIWGRVRKFRGNSAAGGSLEIDPIQAQLYLKYSHRNGFVPAETVFLYILSSTMD